MIANKLINDLDDDTVVSKSAKQPKLKFKDYRKSVNGLCIVMKVLKRLASRLGTNEMNYNPVSLINTLNTTNNRPHVAFRAKAQEIEYVLSYLKKDFPPHMLALRYLEQLHATSNFKWHVQSRLQPLRDRLRKFGGTHKCPSFTMENP